MAFQLDFTPPDPRDARPAHPSNPTAYSRTSPYTSDEELSALIAAGLDRVPQNLITDAQRADALAGRPVKITDAQHAASKKRDYVREEQPGGWKFNRQPAKRRSGWPSRARRP